MTISNASRILSRPLVLTLMATIAVPALMAVPMASQSAYAQSSGNTYQADKAREKSRRADRQQHRQERRKKTKTSSQRERDWREDRRQGHGDWSNDRERQRRYERAQRDQRAHRQREREETRRTERRRERRLERERDRRRWDRERRRDNWRRDARRDNWRRERNDWRRERRWERRNDRYWRRQNRRDYYRPYWNTSSYTGWNDRYNGYNTNYRSSVGISFIFGQPGYSRYRWAPNRNSFYRPQYTSYANYQATTQCERVIIDGFHMGHNEQVSVLQCNNPYEGSYIVQGSEQVVNCRY